MRGHSPGRLWIVESRGDSDDVTCVETERAADCDKQRTDCDFAGGAVCG